MEGLARARELVNRAQRHRGEACFDAASETLAQARDAMAGIELAGTIAVEAAEIKLDIDAEAGVLREACVLAEGEACMASAYLKLAEEDCAQAIYMRKAASACFARVYSGRGNKICRPGLKEEEMASDLALFRQEHDAQLALLDTAIAKEKERISQIAAGEASLAAANKRLDHANWVLSFMGGRECAGEASKEIAGAKDERAAAAYAFTQANCNRKGEMEILNDRFVETERLLKVARGEEDMLVARRKLASQDFSGSRAAVRSAAIAFADGVETTKLKSANIFKEEIAEAELGVVLSSVDSVLEVARQGLYRDEIEGAREERGKAAAAVDSAEVLARPLYAGCQERCLAIVAELAQLSEDHAPCKGLLTLLHIYGYC